MDSRDRLLRACAASPDTLPEQIWEIVATADHGRMTSDAAVAFLAREDLPRHVLDALIAQFHSFGVALRHELWSRMSTVARIEHLDAGELLPSDLRYAAKVAASRAEAAALARVLEDPDALEELFENPHLDLGALTAAVEELLARSHDDPDLCCGVLDAAASEGFGAVARDAVVAGLAARTAPCEAALRKTLLGYANPTAPWVPRVVDALLDEVDTGTLRWLCSWAATATRLPGDVVAAVAAAAQRHTDPDLRRRGHELLNPRPSGPGDRIGPLRAAAAAGDTDAVRRHLKRVGRGLPRWVADELIANRSLPAEVAWDAARLSRNSSLQAAALLELRPGDVTFAGMAYASAPNDEVAATLAAQGTLERAAVGALCRWRDADHRCSPALWEAAAVRAGEALRELPLQTALYCAPHSATIAAAVSAVVATDPVLAVELGDTFAGTLDEFAQLLAAARG